jgi:hypothetical protein
MATFVSGAFTIDLLPDFLWPAAPGHRFLLRSKMKLHQGRWVCSSKDFLSINVKWSHGVGRNMYKGEQRGHKKTMYFSPSGCAAFQKFTHLRRVSEITRHLQFLHRSKVFSMPQCQIVHARALKLCVIVTEGLEGGHDGINITNIIALMSN